MAEKEKKMIALVGHTSRYSALAAATAAIMAAEAAREKVEPKSAWACIGCNQLNSHWATECGRCGKTR